MTTWVSTSTSWWRGFPDTDQQRSLELEQPRPARSTPAPATFTALVQAIEGHCRGLKLGFDNNVSVFLSAVEGITDTTVLANPKVLALNKQCGEVIVGRRDGYLTTTTTDTSTVRVELQHRHASRLPPVHRGRRLHPHGNPPGRQLRLARPTTCSFKITTEVTSNIMVERRPQLFRESSTSSRSDIRAWVPAGCGAFFRNQKDNDLLNIILLMLTS